MRYLLCHFRLFFLSFRSLLILLILPIFFFLASSRRLFYIPSTLSGFYRAIKTKINVRNKTYISTYIPICIHFYSILYENKLNVKRKKKCVVFT